MSRPIALNDSRACQFQRCQFSIFYTRFSIFSKRLVFFFSIWYLVYFLVLNFVNLVYFSLIFHRDMFFRESRKRALTWRDYELRALRISVGIWYSTRKCIAWRRVITGLLKFSLPSVAMRALDHENGNCDCIAEMIGFPIFKIRIRPGLQRIKSESGWLSKVTNLNPARVRQV